MDPPNIGRERTHVVLCPFENEVMNCDRHDAGRLQFIESNRAHDASQIAFSTKLDDFLFRIELFQMEAHLLEIVRAGWKDFDKTEISCLIRRKVRTASIGLISLDLMDASRAPTIL